MFSFLSSFHFITSPSLLHLEEGFLLGTPGKESRARDALRPVPRADSGQQERKKSRVYLTSWSSLSLIEKHSGRKGTKTVHPKNTLNVSSTAVSQKLPTTNYSLGTFST